MPSIEVALRRSSTPMVQFGKVSAEEQMRIAAEERRLKQLRDGLPEVPLGWRKMTKKGEEAIRTRWWTREAWELRQAQFQQEKNRRKRMAAMGAAAKEARAKEARAREAEKQRRKQLAAVGAVANTGFKPAKRARAQEARAETAKGFDLAAFFQDPFGWSKESKQREEFELTEKEKELEQNQLVGLRILFTRERKTTDPKYAQRWYAARDKEKAKRKR